MLDPIEELERIAADLADSSSKLSARKVLDIAAGWPLDVPVPGTPVPQAAAELGEQVRSAMLHRSGFPGRLGQLGDLPDGEARKLLGDLLEALLTAEVSQKDLAATTERLSSVVAALDRDGTRRITAVAPTLPLAYIAAGGLEWRGGLLALVTPRDVVALALPQLRSGTVAARRTALSRLAAVASQLGRPPLPLPMPQAADGTFARLALLLRPVVEPEVASVPRRQPRPPLDGESVPPAPPLPSMAPDRPVQAGGPVRSAYALLDAPDHVRPARPFELRVGLAEHSVAGVVQDAPFEVPAAAFTLQVTVVAPGFRLLGGGSWTRELAVSPEDPFPYDVLRLMPLDGSVSDRAVLAGYVVDGRTLGWANRVVRVADDAGEPAPPLPQGDVWVLRKNDPDPPDVEVVIVPGNDTGRSNLAWYVRSRHPGVVVGDGRYSSVLQGTEQWAKETIRGIEDRKAAGDLGAYLAGAGGMIADAVPPPVWDVLRSVHALTGAPPTVLLATFDPYIPWELAQVANRWDRSAPAVLGAQAVIGRWPLGGRKRTPGPEARLALRSMGVVSGDYQGRLSLPQAEEEAAEIRADYGATTIEALGLPIIDCLSGSPAVDALHFALHGSSGTAGTNEGLLMADGGYLSPISVRGGVSQRLDAQPSTVKAVFMNACQLGQGRSLLGEYAGMASVLLGLGVDVVVAPLWKVDDTVAKDVATAFYDAVLRGGVGPAEQIRRERVATAGQEGSPAGTRLAYLYFGHPCLQLTWSGTGGGDRA